MPSTIPDSPIQEISNFYLEKDEPTKSCLLALKEIILEFDDQISEAWKYKMPFFLYKGEIFCYLWINKKTGEPYIGIVEGNKIDHLDLIAGERKRMKILMIDPNKDIPIETIYSIFSEAVKFYC